MQTIKVRASGTALVPDIAAQDAGVRRYIGRVAVIVDDRITGFDSSGEVSVPVVSEYVRAVRDGDLEVCDADSARICGVQFKAVETVIAFKAEAIK